MSGKEPDSEVVNSRVFDAPREVVFKAFTDPAQLAKWWGPAGFSNTFSEFDFRPGGSWRFVMHGPDGKDYKIEKVFEEVVKPERIVMRHVEPMHSFRMTMVYEDLGPKTRLTWRMVFEEILSGKLKRFLAEANEQNYYRLAAHLAARPNSNIFPTP